MDNFKASGGDNIAGGITPQTVVDHRDSGVDADSAHFRASDSERTAGVAERLTALL